MTTRVVSVAFLLALLPGAVWAGWSTSPIPNGVYVAVEQDTQDGAVAASDGAGGTIVVWRDLREDHLNYYPYIQRLDAAGNEQWLHSGVKIPSRMGDYGYVEFDHWPALAPDGAGGASVAYDSQTWLGAQFERVGPEGSLAYSFEPLPNADSQALHNDVQCFADGQGNKFVFWHGAANPGGKGIAGQKLDSSDTRLWGDNGITFKSGPMNQYAVCPDGAGGFLVAYDSANVVRVLRIDGSGNSLWGTLGVSANGSFAGSTGAIEIVQTGPGEYILAWEATPTGGDSNIYDQKFDSNGNRLWFVNGRNVCVATGRQTFHWFLHSSQQLVSDGTGGAFVTWQDARVDTNEVVYLQHVNGSGVALLQPNGTPLAPGRTVGVPVTVTDGAGGVLVFWGDRRDNVTPLSGVYAQHFTSSNAALWGFGGIPIRKDATAVALTAVPTEGGGAVVYWNEYLFLEDLYAGRVDSYGNLGEVDPRITSVTDIPADQGGNVRVNWNKVSLDVTPSNPVGNYLLWREVPQASALRRIAGGAKVASVGTAAPLAGGETLWTTQTLAGATHYWEYAGTVPASGAGSYQATVATTTDSIPGANPTTAFMVSASSASVPGQHWNTLVATGYSVDNLAPAKPVPFTGQYAGGTAHLHWNRNSEPDLAGYRLYRGTDASFTPGPGNQIASPPDTGYTDVAGGSFVYKLTAVDVHGNQSAANVLSPGGVTGLGDDATLALGFAPIAPNPARGGTVSLRFTLPRAMRAGISVFGVNGRRVLALAPRAFDAGDQSVALPIESRLGAGVYVVRLETEAGVIARRLAVVP